MNIEFPVRELVEQLFAPQPGETRLLILADLPVTLNDHEGWRWRRRFAQALARETAVAFPAWQVSLGWYANASGNNADLPRSLRFDGTLEVDPEDEGALSALPERAFVDLWKETDFVVAPTELSATAPLKNATRAHGFRAATMPGFSQAMLPALSLDYGEIARRVTAAKRMLDQAHTAHLTFVVDGRPMTLQLDLRFRTGHASSGLIHQPGTAGNFPSGESYIVPYEGEKLGRPSRSSGVWPVQFGDEVVLFKIEENKIQTVLSAGAASNDQRRAVAAEPGYRNIAELGIGVLGDMGLAPTGTVLLDEKLGVHIALGRSDHFGGQTGVDAFSSPEAVVHIDHVYIPELQPKVHLETLVLEDPQQKHTIVEDGQSRPFV